MGMYNYLVLHGLTCPRCGHTADHTVQFHFGHVTLHDYEIGDTLRWSPRQRDNRGEPGHHRVVTEGLTGAHPDCDGPFGPRRWPDDDLIDIYLDNDVITHATWHDGTVVYPETDRRRSTFLVLDTP
ncbi:hypothetical protein [Lentzea flaviverrucosa]|uniref:Uncharacterized protein n=1 Tax=Lentzea flaviverrucosa TaxID=200379 RepID=A0A1H9B324_9PSEU|nr:hypothetical protein [Lentzea flaviverrucosa]RDI31899.1 hypothetical protein DFR72_103300 [Lentzea flaviverrucosa]SEP83245.1 hypothetical protein SAMN05216195_101358 [Lentzea flaviverrucosa]